MRDKSIKDAPIVFVWDAIIGKCRSNYIPSEQLTVDEQLCNTRGRVPFKTYIPTKPGKYGIKIWVLADSKNGYLCNAQIYTGKQGNTVEKNQGQRVVLQLAEPYLNKGRTITADNFFSTIDLANNLITKKTAFVGTVRKQRTFLPIEFQKNSRDIGFQFLFENKITLCKYTHKPGKSVVMISSLHDDNNIEENNKPEIINYYNQTKAGVDLLDQIVRFYTVKRKSKRWPMTIFYNLLDIIGYNSFIIYAFKYPEYVKRDKSRARRRFLKELSEEILDNYGEIQSDRPAKAPKCSNARKRCQVCPREKDTKTKSTCSKCSISCCQKHLHSVCDNCL